MKFLLIILYSCVVFAFNAPFSSKKFQDILSKAKLQAPTSSYNPMFSRKYGDFKGYYNKYFYMISDNMIFYMCGNHKRSELRFKNIWKTSTKEEKILFAKVKLVPLTVKKEFTFLQIHADTTLPDMPSINKPLLRIIWHSYLRGRKNHIWAVIRLSPSEYANKYLKVDLGRMPAGFFTIKIVVRNNILKVFFNNKEKVKLNVGYWSKYYNYFKAGVYLQDKGCAKAIFNKLIIKDE